MQTQFSGKISEHDTQQDCENALSGKDQHRDADDDERQRQHVFQKAQREANCRRLLVKPVASVEMGECISWQFDDNPWDRHGTDEQTNA